MTNPNHTQLIDRLKSHLTQNTGEVLQQLSIIFQKNLESRNEVVVITNNYNRLLRDRRKNLITYSELTLEISKINNSLLQLIDTISEEDAQAYEVQTAIFQRILVVCLHQERKAFMEKLLPEKFYKDLDYQLWKTPDDKLDVNRYQLIIFDANLDAELIEEEYIALYRHYLETAQPYLLYFGKGRVPDMNARGEIKAYFANSVFSIHARIQEMITFLKYSAK